MTEYTIGIGGDTDNYYTLRSFLISLGDLSLIDTEFRFNQISDVAHSSYTSPGWFNNTSPISIEINGNGYKAQGTSSYLAQILRLESYGSYTLTVRDIILETTYPDGDIIYTEGCSLLTLHHSFLYCSHTDPVSMWGLSLESDTAIRVYSNIFYNLQVVAHRDSFYTAGPSVIENNTFFNCGGGFNPTYNTCLRILSVGLDLVVRNNSFLRDDGFTYDINCTDTSTLFYNNVSSGTTFADLAIALPGQVVDCIDGLDASTEYISTNYTAASFCMIIGTGNLYNTGTTPLFASTDYANRTLVSPYPIGAYQYFLVTSLGYSVTDETYIYKTTLDSSALSAYNVVADELVHIVTLSTLGYAASNALIYSNGFIVVNAKDSGGTSNLVTLTFNGSTFSIESTTSFSSSEGAQGMALDDNNVLYVPCGLDGLYAFDFNPTTGATTYLNKFSVAGKHFYGIDVRNNFIFTTFDSVISILQFSGATFTEIYRTSNIDPKGYNTGLRFIKAYDDSTVLVGSNWGTNPQDAGYTMLFGFDGLRVELLNVFDMAEEGTGVEKIEVKDDRIYVASQAYLHALRIANNSLLEIMTHSVYRNYHDIINFGDGFILTCAKNELNSLILFELTTRRIT